VIAGSRVLVTGAEGAPGGSLVGELYRQIDALAPAALLLFRGDVRNPQAVDEYFADARPDIVVHAATLTHRRLTERRPSEAVKTNVQGTEHVLHAAVKSGAQRFVLASSPLAADRGASMAGASLRVAELIVERAAARARKKQGEGAPILAAVRVGQAIDAGLEGSVPDLLAVQIAAGGPVTLSSPDAVVAPLTLRKTVKRTLRAAEHAVSGRIYEVDMGTPVRVVDLVARVARERGLPEVPIRFTDARRGYPPGGVTGRGQGTARVASHVYAVPGCADPSGLADLPERLQKLYAAARKNRDPRVRQQLARLARA
jgi:FlaA1/EpsC-like NDP-sugar epimerase